MNLVPCTVWQPKSGSNDQCTTLGTLSWSTLGSAGLISVEHPTMINPHIRDQAELAKAHARSTTAAAQHYIGKNTSGRNVKLFVCVYST